MRYGVATLAVGLLCTVSALAQAKSLASEEEKDSQPETWNVNAPPEMAVQHVTIAVDEGSWMNIDISPDGKQIAFDLLGDIYTLPIEGGAATRIAQGLAYEHQPRFSPDGKRIAFVSDRGGGDNIWLMNRDGSDKRQLSKENFRLLNQPSWSPDGRFLIAKKHFTTSRSLGTGEIWLYHVSGGEGVALVERVSEEHQKELGEPIFSPDGLGIYYTRNVTSGSVFQYAQDSNRELFNIERYDMNSGEITTIVDGEGGAVRPTPSPDGTKIAFVRREQARSKLYVKDMTSGEERKISDVLDQDMQETWAVTGAYPNMAWTPDSRALVFWAKGKIWKTKADGSQVTSIPFTVNDTRPVIESLHPAVEVAPAHFTTQMVRWAETSPDGKQIVFESLGKLWIKSAKQGKAKRLTSDKSNAFELWPSWSRDSRSIVFVRWSDADLGEIRVIANPTNSGATSLGKAKSITTQPSHYAQPRFSPDGKMIVFERRASEGLTSRLWTDNPGIYRVSSQGGPSVLVSKKGYKPQFAASNERLFMIVAKDDKLQLVSSDLSGEAMRTHANGELVSDYAVSPDGKTLAFQQNYQAFVVPLMPGEQDVALDKKSEALPVTRASSNGADYIHWSRNGTQLHWSMGATLYGARVADMFESAPAPPEAPEEASGRGSKSKASKRKADKSDRLFSPPTDGIALARKITAAKPSRTLAIVGAKLVTMADKAGGVIEDGAIIIKGNRISAIGPRSSTAIPAGAVLIDAAGKTIIPGLIDAHAHGPQGEDELVPQQNWSNITNLAMGTTTIHDPSSRASEIFVASEMQRAGLLLAPRIFSTGEIIYGAKAPSVYAEISDYEDALAHVRRLKAQGARSVKNYNQPRREQRQMVVRAAQAEDMLVVPEGGSLYAMDVSLIQDGNATIEHNIPLEYFYADLVQLWGQSRTNYTPTLVVTYGGLAGDPYWRSHSDVWRNPILKRHIPPRLLVAANKRRLIAPEEDYVDGASAREAKKIADAGRMVSIGAHGEQAGLGAHWEMWSFVRGGWSALDALRAATIMPAMTLGYAKDIGSLEVGKLADLVILDADPMHDIRSTARVHRVMLDGRLYDPLSMNEVTTGNRQRAPYWWEAGKK